MVKVKVKSPFSMAGRLYNIGDIIEVEKEKAYELECQKLVAKPKKDKMIKKARYRK